MKRLLSAAAVLATCAVPLSSQAQAQEASPLEQLLDINNLTRAVIDFGVLMLRSQVDVTYEGISVSRAGSEISIVGLKFFPFYEWDPEGFCEIGIARLDLSNSGRPGQSEMHIEAVGTEVASACLPPEPREALSMTGYPGIDVERLYVDLSFDVGSSALDVDGHLALKDAAVIDVAATFDYFWFRDTGYGDPDPAMQLSSAVVSIEDRGLLERIRPIVPPEAFSFDAAPQIVTRGLQEALGEGGFRQLTPAETAFTEQAGAAVGEFLGGAGTLTVTSRPRTPVWLGPDTFRGPGDVITMLEPKIEAGTTAGSASMVPASVLAAALDGGALGDAEAKQAGLALLTGVGAPLAPALGRSLLEPLAGSDPEAALALAGALADDDPVAAYRFALAAAAGGADGGLAALDGIEQDLTADQILSLQTTDRGSFISGVQSVAELRDGALAALMGVSRPRSYEDAYVMASLAAAAGDLSSAALRDRILRRLADHGGDGWEGTFEGLNQEVLGVWTGMLAPRLSGGN